MVHYWNLCLMNNHKLNVYTAENLSVVSSNLNDFQTYVLKPRFIIIMTPVKK